MFICELIDKKGNSQGFEAYGPPAETAESAQKFECAEAAERAVMSRYGRSGIAFGDAERRAAKLARKRHAGWTFNLIKGV